MTAPETFLLPKVSLKGAPPNVFFAHNMALYGTRRVEAVREGIRKAFPEATLHCPESFPEEYEAAAAGREPHMDAYRRILSERLGTTGAVVTVEHNGAVGRGVYEELYIAGVEMRLPIWAMRDTELVPVWAVKRRGRGDWTHYGTLIIPGPAAAVRA